MSDRNYDAIILGAGPAGLSAALGLGHVKRTALVLSNSTYRNEGIETMHDVLGYDGAHPVSYKGSCENRLKSMGSVLTSEMAKLSGFGGSIRRVFKASRSN
ncbi:hypothetical protein N7G274_002414 [Stereocaulon virgatum]|uniref:Thioredoxin reductase n=1 Tax=Stereocaulon virgatum TaxID=373712 RepID=A0ABR4AKJ2_9LECA